MVSKRILRYIFIVTAIAAGIILLCFNVHAAQPFELHLLDVGQGQSVLIEADGHYMLLDVDLPWVDDIHRYRPKERESFFRKCEDQLVARGLSYTVIRGKNECRLANAVACVDACVKRFVIADLVRRDAGIDRCPAAF